MDTKHSCAVGCGMDEEYATSPIYPCCGAGTHFAHLECLARILETNDEPACPVCRDPFLKIVKDLCVKNPTVVDDEDTNDPEWTDDEDDEEDVVSDASTVPCFVHENKILRDTLYALANQYRHDHHIITRAMIHDV